MAQPTPASNMRVIGIDLGTTNSCVGVWLNGRVEIVPSDQEKRTTPSCVAFTDSERLIGDGANHQVATNASNTVFDVKRLIGRNFSDSSVQSDAKYWPFELIEGPGDRPKIKVSYLGKEKELSPEEISAMVLTKMKETAEAYVGEKIMDAVITVPAYFNSLQRQATKDAGIIAGLNVMRILSEPTAAAIAYTHNRNWKETTVLIYDMGGGTLDVSVAVVRKVQGPEKDKFVSQLQVIATAGDMHLGGQDFTNNMVDHFVREFKIKNPDISGDIRSDKKALGRLRRSCQVAKRGLSTIPRIPLEVNGLFQGIDFHSEITRDDFEKINEDLFRRCMDPIDKCLNDAKMDKSKVEDVVLVGGCTRIPRVHQLVKDLFGGKELCRNINADEAVAYGATIQAAMLVGGNGWQVVDITPFSQGIGMLEGPMLEMIPRNSTIPATKQMPFVAVKAEQSSMEITVYEDERAMANRFRIALEPRTDVAFQVDPDGILKVGVWANHKEGWKTIPNLVGSFSTEEVNRMVMDAHKYKDQDEEHKMDVQARNDIQNLLFTISNDMKNLEDSAAGLLPQQQQQEATDQEQGKETKGFFRSLVPHKAHDKENMKMIQQAHNDDTLKKLPGRIKKLQETADEATMGLENEEITTSMIIQQKKLIEDEYHSICKLIETASISIKAQLKLSSENKDSLILLPKM